MLPLRKGVKKMKLIYACLPGNWVCLNDDENCTIGDNNQSPSVWYEESAPVYAPLKRTAADSYYQLNYVNLVYRGVHYRINPVFIQVTEG